MSRIWTFLTKNLLRGIFMGMLVILLLRIGGTSVLALAQSCGQWSVVSSPNVGTAANTLYGVTAVSPNDIWAVGSSTNATLTEHWNGTQWSVVSSPSSGTNSRLTAVTAVSSKNVWAVGFSQSQSNSQTLIEHWNGKKWRIVPSPDNGGVLLGVTTISKKDIWAVGITATSQTLTEHWNGKSWSVVSNPTLCQGGILYGVTAIATNDVWAVGVIGCGGTLTEHWDGSQWSIIPSPNPMPDVNYLYAVTAIASNDVWTVGEGKDLVPPFVPITEHWDGTSWTAVPAPAQNHSSGMTGVAAASTNNIWAVGYLFIGSKQGTVPQTYHWDGTSWTSIPNPGIGNSVLNAVAVTSAGDFWAVGEFVPQRQVSQTLTEFYC